MSEKQSSIHVVPRRKKQSVDKWGQPQGIINASHVIRLFLSSLGRLISHSPSPGRPPFSRTPHLNTTPTNASQHNADGPRKCRRRVGEIDVKPSGRNRREKL
ncbi:hypothetical protein I3760_05G004700 [Carya illinoinensis]|nr:hypothetical protein I3760_05G004700 [Carya illinoinensis]